jgi:hypothetical protein
MKRRLKSEATITAETSEPEEILLLYVVLRGEMMLRYKGRMKLKN